MESLLWFKILLCCFKRHSIQNVHFLHWLLDWYLSCLRPVNVFLFLSSCSGDTFTCLRSTRSTSSSEYSLPVQVRYAWFTKTSNFAVKSTEWISFSFSRYRHFSKENKTYCWTKWLLKSEQIWCQNLEEFSPVNLILIN